MVYQDDLVFVLLNAEPLKEGHLMILPVRHAEDLGDLSPDESQAFLRTIDRCMAVVTKAFDDTPMCLVNGWKFRTQPHLHAHVLPSKTTMRGLYVAAEGVENRKRAEDGALRQTAERLRVFFEKI
jgi:diadenosine tetraphosphate (Ap4A) HIT family hydrolase